MQWASLLRGRFEKQRFAHLRGGLLLDSGLQSLLAGLGGNRHVQASADHASDVSERHAARAYDRRRSVELVATRSIPQDSAN
jgi:hypothetical protein